VTHVSLLGQAVPHAPQLLESFVVSVHFWSHAVVPDAQLAAHVPEAHNGSVPVQAMVQLPQVAAAPKSASQPSFGSPLQSAKPAAHEDVGTTQAPAVHDVGPATCASEVQSLSHVPQWAGSERSVVHPSPAPAQSANPDAH